MTPGERIKSCLRELEQTQDWLARESGIARERVNKIVNDKAGLGPNNAGKLARVLDLPVSELLERGDLRPSEAENLRAVVEELAARLAAVAKSQKRIETLLRSGPPRRRRETR